MRPVLSTLVLLLGAVAVLGPASAAFGRSTAWTAWWGKTSTANGTYQLSSQAPTSPDATHSALLTSTATWGDQTFSYTATTIKQLRRGSAPNPWEVAWSLFRFSDLEDYYYFILKPNGFELGKKQGSDAQIFLVTGDEPHLTIGQSNRVVISAVGPRIQVTVDGTQVLDYTDPNPLPAGSVGLYEEDAQVQFENVGVAAA